ncbi:thyroid receptor-interacting protein 6-like [Sycon ciliatum]|uniref:thyroid receptor-interacting protein 6-like n=1 Tax=Sycon ciliatum TaxID=27933 RepID=UPI0020ADAB0C|eukprot:scpid78592/ scgid26281/ Thyroid receptor-interacting protein 6; Opa-interacting protein 1; Zyxin-related protein 1
MAQLVESLGPVSQRKKTAVRNEAFAIEDDFLDDLDAPPRPPPPSDSKPGRPPPPGGDDFPAPPPGDEAETEVDNLTKILVKNMEHAGEEGFFGFCNICEQKVIGSENGVQAMGKIYHTNCFVCGNCTSELRGKPFFTVETGILCDSCYHGTLERCAVCKDYIKDRILRAMDMPFHPDCFKCHDCPKMLDGIPFTTDADSQVYCLDCYHRKFAPRCASCQEPIVPEEGKEETLRVISMDKSFHVGCFNCQDCGKNLSAGENGQGCYPYEGALLCRDCNIKRVQAGGGK